MRGSSASMEDPSWDLVFVEIWSHSILCRSRGVVTLSLHVRVYWSKAFPVVIIQLKLAIIVACLPALNPLFKSVPLLASIIPLSIRSRFSKASAISRAPWPRKSSAINYDPEQRGSSPWGYVPTGESQRCNETRKGNISEAPILWAKQLGKNCY